MKVFLEIENTQTGEMIRRRIGEDKLNFFREHRDDPVEHYTRPLELTAAEVHEWNGRDHCVYGEWETITQNSVWRNAIFEIVADYKTTRIAITRG